MAQIKKKKNIPKPTYFGANLKLLRRMHGMTQTELSEKLNVSRNNIASYESGMVEPNANLFIKACLYFDIAPKEMLQTILSQHPIANTVNISDDIKPIDHYIIDQFDLFVAETNNSTKILEGFKAFRALDESREGEGQKDFDNILDDLLSLMDKLVKINWDLINSIIPSEKCSE